MLGPGVGLGGAEPSVVGFALVSIEGFIQYPSSRWAWVKTEVLDAAADLGPMPHHQVLLLAQCAHGEWELEVPMVKTTGTPLDQIRPALAAAAGVIQLPRMSATTSPVLLKRTGIPAPFKVSTEGGSDVK